MELIIIVLGIVLDRITKLWAIRRLLGGRDICIVKDFLSFSYLENTGAAFGVFRNRLAFLIIITSIVLLLIIGYLIKVKPSSKVFRLSLTLIVSGAIGNLIDRIQYNYVVDFILVHYKNKYYFPVFNVADILVSCGAVLLAIYIIKEDENGKERIFS